jgi:hypothetical protein
MRQHPDPDEDGLEATGTPVYQGNGLSVRALTAEELQRFLDAHIDQPAHLVGSGWVAVDPSAHLLGASRTPLAAEHELHAPYQRSQPSRVQVAWVALADPPSRNTGGVGRRSWPAGRAAWLGGYPSWPLPAWSLAHSPPRPVFHGPGWLPPRWSAGGCASVPPSRPAPGSAAPTANARRPGC